MRKSKEETPAGAAKPLNMNLGSTVQRLGSTEFSRLDDAYLAIDSEKGCCYSLNGTAGRVWELTEQPVRLADLCLQMQREFSVEEQTCQRDILALVTSLHEAGLLQITGSSK